MIQIPRFNFKRVLVVITLVVWLQMLYSVSLKYQMVVSLVEKMPRSIDSHYDEPFIVLRSNGDFESFRIERQTPRKVVLPDKARQDAGKTVLILCILHGDHSFGSGRNFSSFLQMIAAFEYPMYQLSLGFLMSDYEDLQSSIPILDQFVRDNNLAAGAIYLQPQEETSSREMRQRDDIQRERRSLLAQLRNRLLLSTLRHEDAVLWIDSDIVEIQSDALKQFVRSGLDIVTPFCRFGTKGMESYDGNAWVGRRKRPSEEQWKQIKEGTTSDFVPNGDGAEMVVHWIDKDDKVVELDSVGGTVLYVRADVHRNGVNFPPFYLIGSDWDAKYGGYDGIETEGLCYIARTIGYRCWAMPHITVSHTYWQETPKHPRKSD
ncbi:Anp1-domain-containing protein [Polychytrium aggregatum]|uniref:Anp1-domain-containing protein n=1 Tax=Polychytrium aggregatum TaxID=110093 RepID=UPI0022FE841F|nr:Anp1-domain-containing protein [Polychytrium aggregatum]KAI9199376.1 Anp1-domain-containing protein [Polychytrium aggregatum]